MTETVGKATSAARDGADGATRNPLSDIAHSEAADRLKSEVQDYLAAQATRLLSGVGQKLGETTGKLNDIAEGNSPGFAKLAADGGKKLAEGKGPLRTAVELGATRAKDNVKGALQNLGGGKGKRKKSSGNKPTVIMEYIDVGVPLRTAYDQWTQYQDFSTFAKGVKSANKSDDTTSDWQAKIWWSSRSWKASTSEQVPDDRIAWSTEGAKGTMKGVVSFHKIAENLTRVLMVIEYYPSGFFEKTGNIWRAQGRRARLDLKNFARFITIKGEAEDSWRGEIREGEVVKSHEDAVAEEEEEQGAEGEQEDSGSEDQDGEPDAEAEDAYDDEDAEDDGTEPEDAYEDEEADEDGTEPEDAYEDEDGEDGGTEPEDEAGGTETDDPYEDEDEEAADGEDDDYEEGVPPEEDYEDEDDDEYEDDEPAEDEAGHEETEGRSRR